MNDCRYTCPQPDLSQLLRARQLWVSVTNATHAMSASMSGSVGTFDLSTSSSKVSSVTVPAFWGPAQQFQQGVRVVHVIKCCNPHVSLY